MMDHDRITKLFREQFEQYMEAPEHPYYINKKAANFDVEDFIKESTHFDIELGKLWNALDEDAQEELTCEILNWLYEPTKEDWECDSKYDAWKDGDR